MGKKPSPLLTNRFRGDFEAYAYLRDGSCIRDYIHVEDIANAIALALNHLQKGGKSSIYNLGSGKGISNKELLAQAKKLLGKKMRVQHQPARPGDPAVVIAAISKIKNELNFEPKNSDLVTILKSVIDYNQLHSQILKNKKNSPST